MNALTTPVSAAVAVALDALSFRQQALATNLANVNTTGYRAAGVDFEAALQSALQDAPTAPDEALQKLGELRDDLRSGEFSSTARDAGVELDMQLAQMSETVLRYQALIEGLGKYGSLTRMAIAGEVKG